MGRGRAAAAVACTLVLLAGCRSEEPPAGELTVAPESLVLPYPGFADLQLSFRLPGLKAGADHPVVFVHLVGEPGEVYRTFDHPLPPGWEGEQELTYPLRLYQSALGPSLPPGRYSLTVGLYEPDGVRWALATAGADVGRYEYTVATVEVPAAPAEAPELEFSPSWLPLESGTDRQVLARRWLAGEGTIRLAGTAGPGVVWLSVAIPPADAPGSRVVWDPPGENGSLTVVVTTSCGATEITLSGAGTQQFEVPVDASGQGGSCEIRFRPNFFLLLEGSFERRSLALEALSWSPGL
jgi:hypothetical protein